MAAAAIATPPSTQVCGYCFEGGDNLRVLPCSHTFCTPCMQRYLDEAKVLKCGKCRATYDRKLSELPSASGSNLPCQSCERKGVRENAVVYCKECDNKFCHKHMQSHNDIFTHNVISIGAYIREGSKLQPRYCSIHTNSVLSLACEVCSNVMCNLCLDGKVGCTAKNKYSKHQLVSLSALVDRIGGEIGKLKAVAQEKEKELSELLKQSSCAVADVEYETEQYLQLLHNSREDQIDAIRKKYSSLEKQFLTLRQQSTKQLSDFIEKDVGVRLDTLGVAIQSIEASMRDCHEVDLIQKLSGMEKHLKELVCTRNPSLSVKNFASLQVNGVCREPELKIVQTAGSIVLNRPGVYVPVASSGTPPDTLTSTRRVQLPSNFQSVLAMHGETYLVPYSGRICSVEDDGSVRYQSSDTAAVKNIAGVTGYDGEIFLLNYVQSWEVVAVDTRGHFLRKWSHNDDSTEWNQPAAVGGRVVVPNLRDHQLIVYSIKGKISKRIPYTFANGQISICSCGDDSVIVAVRAQPSRVSKVNIVSGQVVWTCSAVANLRSVLCWRDSYVLVVNSSGQISVLHASTGEYIKNLSGRIKDYKGGYISVEDDRMVALVGDSLHFYKIG